MPKALRGVSFPGILFASFAFVLPFVTSRHLFFGAINAKYFFIVGSVSLLALVFCYLLAAKKHTFVFGRRWLVAALGVFLGALAVSAVLGVYPERSFFSDIQRSSGVLFLAYVLLMAWLAGEMLRERDWVLVRRAVIASSALLALWTILGTQGLGFSGRILTVNLDIVGATLANETFAGAYLLLGFVITLVEFFRAQERRVRYVIGAAAILQFVSPLLFNVKALGSLQALAGNPFMLVGGARASSITVFLVLSYVAGYLAIKRFVPAATVKRALYGWGAVWLMGIVALVGLLFVEGSPVQEQYIQESTAARIIVWDSGFRAFAEHPLFGWGPENFRFAFERYFDSRLYLDENLGEIWFDRAHNLVVDTLVTTGIMGAATLLLLWGCFMWIVVRAGRTGLITSLEAQLWGVLVVAHFLQLQTSFDTVATYALTGLILGYGIWLEQRMLSTKSPLPRRYEKGVAGALAALVLVASFFALFGEYNRQNALFSIFTTRDSERQIELIHTALARQSSFESLRFASASFRKGFLEQLATSQRDARSALLEHGEEQFKVYEEYLRGYAEHNPHDYRAHINLAYHLLMQTSLGDDHLTEARDIIEKSYALSPQNPLTHVLDGITSLYGGDLKAAEAKILQAIDANPDTPFSKDMLAYLNNQKKSFPTIKVLNLENL